MFSFSVKDLTIKLYSELSDQDTFTCEEEKMIIVNQFQVDYKCKLRYSNVDLLKHLDIIATKGKIADLCNIYISEGTTLIKVKVSIYNMSYHNENYTVFDKNNFKRTMDSDFWHKIKKNTLKTVRGLANTDKVTPLKTT